MANGEEWDVTLINDRGLRGPVDTDFLNGPRFVVRRQGEEAEAGVVELKLGRVYLASLREALGAPAGDTTLIFDLLDDAGAEEVRQALPSLELDRPGI